MPWLLFEMVNEHLREGDMALVSEFINRTLAVVDLGCGTGLVGKCFSALVREKVRTSNEMFCEPILSFSL